MAKKDYDDDYVKIMNRGLQVLSVNYDYVNDDFLLMLCNCSSLKRIIFHVHSNVQDHPGTTEATWAELTKYWYVYNELLLRGW